MLALFDSSVALAQEMVGDLTAGEALFVEECGSCHAVENELGELLAGGNARTGPNLFGLAGRVPGSVPGARYSPQLVAHGQSGAVWEEASFVAFVLDPSGFLREASGAAPSKMPLSRMPTGVIRYEQNAHHLWAFLAGFSPEGGTTGDGATQGEAASD